MRGLILSAAALVAGCTAQVRVQPGVFAAAGADRPWPAEGLEAAAAQVRVTALAEPAGAAELGLVEAHSRVPDARLPELVAALRVRVAALGGDTLRVDQLTTRYELVDEPYDYECGTTEMRDQVEVRTVTGPDGSTGTQLATTSAPVYVPRTCTGTRQVEVATRTLVGRALRRAKEERR